MGSLLAEARASLSNQELKKVQALVDDAAFSLNCSHKKRDRRAATRGTAGRRKRDVLRLLTLERLGANAGRWLGSCSALEPEHAFSGLLRGKSAYGYPQSSASLASFKNSLLKLPTGVPSRPYVDEAREAHASSMLKNLGDQMLRPAAEIAVALSIYKAVGYMGPVL